MNRAALQALIGAGEPAHTDDADFANRLALDFGLFAIGAANEAAGLDAQKKTELSRLQAKIMEETGMAKTPAETAARAEPEYVALGERQRAAADEAEAARIFARFYGTRARILAATLEVTHG
jgi:hypothetical protein